jgi:hypothetical protein
MTALLRFGKTVLKPWGDNCRYDLVIDDNGKFIRVQCKTARFKDGALYFCVVSSQTHRGKGKKRYDGQIELFGVYSPLFDKVYLVPINQTHGGEYCSLRVSPIIGKIKKKIKWASDYEVKIQVDTLECLPKPKLKTSQRYPRPWLRKADRPDADTLAKLLWEKPTTEIASIYNVSDSAVGKWAKTYGLEKPPRGYWAKVGSNPTLKNAAIL